MYMHTSTSNTYSYISPLLPNDPLRRWAGRNISNTFGAVRQGVGVTSFHRPHHPEFWKMTSANMHAHTYAVHPLIHAHHTTFHILNRPFVLLSFSLCFGVGFSFAILLTPPVLHNRDRFVAGKLQTSFHFSFSVDLPVNFGSPLPTTGDRDAPPTRPPLPHRPGLHPPCRARCVWRDAVSD